MIATPFHLFTSSTGEDVMYCPGCGSKNQDDIRFCTRCGANLALVSEVMSGKLTSDSAVDKRKVELLKDYFNGRRSTLLGSVFLILGLLIMTPLMATKLIDEIPVLGLFALGCMIYGAICLVWGLGRWVDSSSEMKAMEIAVPQRLPNMYREQLGPAPVENAITVAKSYSTDPIAPVSVTEQTTRSLEERAAGPVIEGEERKR
jgi:hypothetical protein